MGFTPELRPGVREQNKRAHPAASTESGGHECSGPQAGQWTEWALRHGRKEVKTTVHAPQAAIQCGRGGRATTDSDKTALSARSKGVVRATDRDRRGGRG